jgi:hypothetical protein
MITISLQNAYYIFSSIAVLCGAFYKLGYEMADTSMTKAHCVLMYIHFQIYSKAYKTDDFP